MRARAAAQGWPIRILVAMFLAALALRPDVIGVGPILEPMREDLGAPRAVIGLLPTVPVLCMGVFAPLAGRLAARVGPRRVILAGLALIAVAGMARAGAPGTTSLVAVTVAVGLGIALVQTLLPAMVKQQAGEHTTLATTVYVVGIQLGAATSAGVSGPLAAAASWRLPLLAFGLAAALWTLAWAVLGPTDKRVDVPLVGVADLRTRRLTREPIAWRLALAFGLQSVVFYGTNAWLAPSLMQGGWDPLDAGRAVSVLNLAALAATLSVPLLARVLVTRRRTLITSAVICLVGLGIVAVAPQGAWWSTLVVGFGLGPLLPVTLSLPLDVADDVDRVAAMAGMMLGFGYLLAASAPTGLGLVRDLTGSFVPVLWLLALITCAFIAVCAGLGPAALRRGLRPVTSGPDGLGSAERGRGPDERR